jgi:hypothetical protein
MSASLTSVRSKRERVRSRTISGIPCRRAETGINKWEPCDHTAIVGNCRGGHSFDCSLHTRSTPRERPREFREPGTLALGANEGRRR